MTHEQNRRAIKNARKDAGLSQVELSREAGISQPKLSSFERGAIDLSPEEIEGLWKAIRVKMPAEFGGVPVADLGLKFFASPDPKQPEQYPNVLLKRSGLSQETLAVRAGITRAKVRSWLERGHRALPFEERGRVWEVLRAATEENRPNTAKILADLSMAYRQPEESELQKKYTEAVERLVSMGAELVEAYKRIIALEESLAKAKKEND